MQNFGVNQAGQFSSPGAAPPPQKSRTGLYIALGLGAVAVFVLLVAAVGGFIIYKRLNQPLSARLPPVVATYTRGDIKTSVTEDLKKDSLEAYSAIYKPAANSPADRDTTVVVVRYPSRERASLAVRDKVKAMQEGAMSRATVTEAETKRVRGKPVGLRYVLAMMVLDQVVWNEDDVFFLITTSGAGNAVRFENSFLSQ